MGWISAVGSDDSTDAKFAAKRSLVGTGAFAYRDRTYAESFFFASASADFEIRSAAVPTEEDPFANGGAETPDDETKRARLTRMFADFRNRPIGRVRYQ